MVLYISMSSKNTITPFVQHVYEKIIHCLHERCLCICQPNGHYDPFVKHILCQEMLSSVCFPQLYGITSILL